MKSKKIHHGKIPEITDEQMKRWSAHMYLAREIAWCAKYLAEKDHGYPNSLTPRKWKQILLDIHSGFSLFFEREGDFYIWKGGREPSNRMFLNKDGRMEMEPTPKGYKLIIDKKALAKYKKAQALFSEWMPNMWD